MKKILVLFEHFGRFASYALPLGLVVGLLIPAIADSLNALLIPTLFISLTLSLVCTPTDKIISSFLRVKLLIVAVLWILVCSPILVSLFVSFIDIDESIVLAVTLAVAASPVTATAAIAIFLKLDSAIAACVTVLSTLLVPITLPLVFHYFVSTNLELSLWSIGLQLLIFILMSFAGAVLLKKILGEKKIAQHKLVFDGISVLSISLFTIGIMSGLSSMLISDPWFVFENLVVSSTLVFGLYCVTSIVFWRAGANSAMAISIAGGNCNLGLMYLVLVNKVDQEVLTFFSVGQIPMYLLPSLLTPLVAKLRQETTA